MERIVCSPSDTLVTITTDAQPGHSGDNTRANCGVAPGWLINARVGNPRRPSESRVIFSYELYHPMKILYAIEMTYCPMKIVYTIISG